MGLHDFGCVAFKRLPFLFYKERVITAWGDPLIRFRLGSCQAGRVDLTQVLGSSRFSGWVRLAATHQSKRQHHQYGCAHKHELAAPAGRQRGFRQRVVVGGPRHHGSTGFRRNRELLDTERVDRN